MNKKKFPKSSLIIHDIEEIYTSIYDVEKLEGEKILITGANGMIPSYLVYFFCYINDFILKKPCELYLIVRNKNLWRINDIIKRKYIHTVIQDIASELKISEKVDYIIHAASFASPNLYMQHPIETINANVLGLYNLLGLDITRLKSFIFFSTAELYGNPDSNHIPTKENYIGATNLHDVRSCYVESKRFGEVLCMNYFRQKSIPVKIIRPFHVFSPEIDRNDGRVFSSFVTNALLKRTIEITGDGKTSRSLCYITDAVIIILKILFSQYNGEIFNVGNQNNAISIKDLALLITDIIDDKISIQIRNKKKDAGIKSAPMRSCPDMNKVKRLLKFQSGITLKEGFSRVINYQKGFL